MSDEPMGQPQKKGEFDAQAASVYQWFLRVLNKATDSELAAGKLRIRVKAGSRKVA